MELSKMLISQQTCDKTNEGHRWSYPKSNEILDNVFYCLRLYNYHYVCNFCEKSSCKFHTSYKKWKLSMFSIKSIPIMSDKFHQIQCCKNFWDDLNMQNESTNNTSHINGGITLEYIHWFSKGN